MLYFKILFIKTLRIKSLLYTNLTLNLFFSYLKARQVVNYIVLSMSRCGFQHIHDVILLWNAFLCFEAKFVVLN